MLVSFLEYQTFCLNRYGITIPSCELENIMPKLDIVESYVLDIFQGEKDCGCGTQTETIPNYVKDVICKGTYYYDNINTSDFETIDKWQEVVFRDLKINGGLIVN